MDYQLKETSVIDANATPPTIGRIEETTQKVGTCSFKNQNFISENQNFFIHFSANTNRKIACF